MKKRRRSVEPTACVAKTANDKPCYNVLKPVISLTVNEPWRILEQIIYDETEDAPEVRKRIVEGFNQKLRAIYNEGGQNEKVCVGCDPGGDGRWISGSRYRHLVESIRH